MRGKKNIRNAYTQCGAYVMLSLNILQRFALSYIHIQLRTHNISHTTHIYNQHIPISQHKFLHLHHYISSSLFSHTYSTCSPYVGNRSLVSGCGHSIISRTPLRIRPTRPKRHHRSSTPLRSTHHKSQAMIFIQLSIWERLTEIALSLK